MPVLVPLTNEDGFVCGAVPANEIMQLEVRSQCGDVLYTQQVGPYSDTTDDWPNHYSGPGSFFNHRYWFCCGL
jgi:hypothetical protein